MYQVKSNKKFFHNIFINEPHLKSWAAYLLLKKVYYRKVKETRPINSEWRIWLTFRNRYLRRQSRLNKGNLVCSYCHTPNLDPNFFNPYSKHNRRKATVDHILTLSKGRKKFDEDNMCVCCNRCNQRKGDKDLDNFKNKLSLLKN